jgi:superfamily II DNA or RNA helicase
LKQWDGTYKFYKGNSFQTGLLHIIQENIDKVILRQPKYSKPEKVNPCVLKDKKMIGKYSYQAESVQAMLEKRRGIVYNATGAGKTNMAAAFLETLKKPALFLTHQKELAKQTIESFEKSMSLSIGMFGSGTDERKLITVGMVPTIARRVKDKDRDVIDWLGTREIVIVDETHLSSADTYLKVLQKCYSASYRLGLSGTPLDRGTIDNLKVMAQLGPVITEVRNKELIALNVSSKPEITMLDIPSLGLDGKYEKVYTQGVVENEYRNRVAVKITKKLLDEGEKVLLIVKRIHHGEILQEMFRRNSVYTAFCHGGSSELERYTALSDIKSGKSRILILSGIGRVGLDLPDLTAGLKLDGGKSVIEVLQGLGRYLRNPTGKENVIKFYDFYDRNEKYLLEHSEKRKAIYEREGFSVDIGRLERSI